jgi:hypothetical protein
VALDQDHAIGRSRPAPGQAEEVPRFARDEAGMLHRDALPGIVSTWPRSTPGHHLHFIVPSLSSSPACHRPQPGPSIPDFRDTLQRGLGAAYIPSQGNNP